jgi:hypothetical protein
MPMDRGRLGRSCEVMETNGPIAADERDSPFERVEDGVPRVDVGLREERDQVGRGAVRPGAARQASLEVVELKPARGGRRRGEQSARLGVAALVNRLLRRGDRLRIGVGRRLRQGRRRSEGDGESERRANDAKGECVYRLHWSVLLLKNRDDSRAGERVRYVPSRSQMWSSPGDPERRPRMMKGSPSGRRE